MPDTVKQAVLQVASMGLSLNPALQQCYLIPRGIKKGDNEFFICYPAPSYRGLTKIVMDTGQFVQVRAEVVFQADKFKYLGPVTKPLHEPVTTSTHRKETHAVGVYAIAEHVNGSWSVEYVDRDTVQAIRRMSEVPNSAMYTTLWTEGWKKIAIRRICKTLNVSSMALAAAIDVLNHNEGIDFEERRKDAEAIEGEATVVDDVQQDDPPEQDPEKISFDCVTELRDLCQENGLEVERVCVAYGVDSLEDLPTHLYEPAKQRIISYGERKNG
jgi:recombination protein RecT